MYEQKHNWLHLVTSQLILKNKMFRVQSKLLRPSNMKINFAMKRLVAISLRLIIFTGRPAVQKFVAICISKYHIFFFLLIYFVDVFFRDRWKNDHFNGQQKPTYLSWINKQNKLMNKNDDKNYYILLYILLIYNIFSKRVFNFHR